MTTEMLSLTGAVLGLVALPELLHASRKFDRVPRVGFTLWLALCAVGWIGAIALFLEIGLGSPRATLSKSILTFLQHLGDGHPLRGLGLTEVVGLSVSFDISVLLLGALAVASWQVWDVRRQQRTVLDLVVEPAHDRDGICLLSHPQPLAYFLPGDGGRIVLSTGAFNVLSDAEINAVIAHEIGHRHGRHGALLAPLQALSSFVAFLPLARYAPIAMRGYLEMSADDYARSCQPILGLKAALEKSALFHRPPLGALGAHDVLIDRRIDRLSSSPAPTVDALVSGLILVSCSSLLWTLLMVR